MHTFKHLLFAGLIALTACSSDPYLPLAEEIAQSEMSHNHELWTCDGAAKPKWEYTPTLMARAFLELYQATGDTLYLNHVQRFTDQFIGEDGSILTYKKSLYNMDRIQGGNFLIMLNDINPQPQYLTAIETLRDQLREQPRTEEGGFWHKQVYEHQMWLDGLFTGTTFYARYAAWKPEPDAWDDIANQFLIVDRHTRKANGLNHHGWDESRQMGWSDSITGCSQETWGRAEGWYVMALCDVLELMPADHPKRPELVAILNRVMDALMIVQNKDTHLWYQVPDRAGEEGNYLESTCSAMYCFAMAKGVRLGLLPEQYKTEAYQVMDGLKALKIVQNEDGTLSLIDCCAVAGLGGNPYRDGTYEYYIHERIRPDDPKGVAPLILACIELSKL
ncbi:MAG: glycoside hydrolase family 88 protein [Paludibacteraceae bacterium]|nr:glycoside hydrolase family 88 protein [Paludibacteraceae bacterium]